MKEGGKYISFLTRLQCPQCGAALFSSGTEVWCSRQGSADHPGCQYGVATIVTLRDHLARMNGDVAQIEQNRVKVKV